MTLLLSHGEPHAQAKGTSLADAPLALANHTEDRDQGGSEIHACPLPS